MARSGPETRLVKKMRDAGHKKYGERLVTVKYHGSQFSESGVADLLCVLDGVFIACEVKAPESYGGSVDRALSEGPTIKQRAFLRRVGLAGGVWSVAATVEQFLETLDAAEALGAGSTLVFTGMDWMDRPEDDQPICTCVPESGCEHDTETGCYYCRTADLSLPCPNLDRR